MRNIQLHWSFDLPSGMEFDTMYERLLSIAQDIEQAGGRFRQFVVQPIDVVSTEVEKYVPQQ